MTPAYEIKAENKDITATIARRLVSLSITDNSSEQADTLRIVIDNADGTVAIPDPGAMLQVHLGYLGYPLRNMGLYVLDEVRESGAPDIITLTAKAAAFADGSKAADYTPLNAKKTRSWDAGKTIADIVKTIASESKLTPVVTRTAAPLVMPHIDQTAESDLNLLTRIADANNSRVKPAFGKLIFAHMNDVRSTAPVVQSTEAVAVDKTQVTTWEYGRKARQHVEAVTATWRDIAGARDVVETVGKKDGITEEIKVAYPDAESAIAAANSRLLDLRRSGTTFDLTLPAPVAMNFYAEGSINVTGFAEKINGVWKLKTVDWNLTASGLIVSLKSEIAAPEKEAATSEE